MVGGALVFGLASTPLTASPGVSSLASYRVQLVSHRPLRFLVTADLPINGRELRMADTYPAELPAMAAGGWPSLVSALEVRDATGRMLDAEPSGAKGWRLKRAIDGRVRLRYLVDFAVFEAAGWSSPRESAIVDEQCVAVCARGLFLFTDRTSAARISIGSPPSWRAVAPWPRQRQAGNYHARALADLTDNFLVFSRENPDIAVVAGFRLQVTAMGHWRPLRPFIRNALQTIVTREVALMGFEGTEAYNVVLMPTKERGGESYRQSFAFAFDNPTPANVGQWANTIAHELFHYWNAARLQGADYASTQWFQEGFTEYVANLVLVTGRIVTPDAFLARLGSHIANARKLTTTLENIGTRKGPPLYSAGALVAFCFDVMLRGASDGRQDIGSFFRNFWRLTAAGERKYTWPDIGAALAATAPGDWRGFYLRHIRGNEPLPLEQAFRQAGLALAEGANGAPLVSIDESAPKPARRLFHGLVTGEPAGA